MKNSILITYKCNKLGEHDCLSTELNSIRVKIFADKMEAIHFIGECTSCDHNIKDVYPELFWWENDSKETTNTNKTLETYRINNIY